jgi:hypothetical protein
MTKAKMRVTLNSRSVWEDAVHDAFETHRPPFDKDFVKPTDLTQGLLIGKNVTIAQARQLIGKVGGVDTPRSGWYGNLYCIRHHAAWKGCSQTQIYLHLKNGSRPFEVDDVSDLL